MVRARLEGVFPTYKTLSDGSRRTYWYHRSTGQRLHGEPGSATFIEDYAAAEKTVRDRRAGTVNGLIRAYTTCVEFQEKLAPSTQAEYKRMLTKAESEFGNMPIAALDDPRAKRDFLGWREKIAAHLVTVRPTTDDLPSPRCSPALGTAVTSLPTT